MRKKRVIRKGKLLASGAHTFRAHHGGARKSLNHVAAATPTAWSSNKRLTLFGASTSVGRLASWITLATMKVFPCDHPAHTNVPWFNQTGGMAHQQIVNGLGAEDVALKDMH